MRVCPLGLLSFPSVPVCLDWLHLIQIQVSLAMHNAMWSLFELHYCSVPSTYTQKN